MIEITVLPAKIPAGAAADMEIRMTNRGQDAYLNIIFTIRMPVGLMRLRGQEKIRVPKLSPGQSFTSPLRVRAEEPGRYQLTSPNFSYRDHSGHARRKTDFIAEIVVNPKSSPPPQPLITAELRTVELPLDEWSTLRGRIANVGDVDVSELEITLSGQVDTEDRSRTFTLGQLRAGGSTDVSFLCVPMRQALRCPST